jgi:uncharacterized protein (DUF2141 family)
MDRIKKMGSIKALTVLSILVVLSGMAAMTSADGWQSRPNEFYGTVTLNGADAPVGTVINAYINGELNGTIEITTAGEYGGMPDLDYLKVIGNESEDEGRTITFTVCGAAADQIGTEWYVDALPRELNLTAEDDVAPAVTNANATPSSIVANGTDMTQLNATVIDGCRCTVGTVTVNLSAIGGDDAQKMTRIGDTYSVDTNASVGTASGTYYLYINASDVFENCNTSVCIALEIVETTTTLIGDINGDCKVDYKDLGILGATYGLSSGDVGYNAAADLNGDDKVDYKDLGMLGAHYGEEC